MKTYLCPWRHIQEEERRSLMRVGLLVGGGLTTLLAAIWLARDWPGAADAWAAKGRAPRVEITALAAVWKALVVDAVLLAGLLATLPWWVGKKPSQSAWTRPHVQDQTSDGIHREAVDITTAPARTRWVMRAAILLVLAFALWLRAPRLTLSFYNDEAHNYARLWSGAWEHKSGEPRLREARWGETLFLNNAGNNSQLFSLAARACLETARAFGWSVPGEVTEWAVRLPSLLAGLLTIWLAGPLARRHFGFTGMLAVMLALALHPWHARYSTEARGYALMLLGVVMMLYFIDLALASQRWRHWLGYSAGLLLCAVSFLGSIYYLICLNAAILVHQVWRWRQTGETALVTRPLVAGLLAVMAALPLVLPILPQLLRVLETHDSIHGVMDAAWWRDVAGYLIAGTRWGDADPENPVNQALARWIGQPLWLASLLAWFALLAAGLTLVWRRGGVPRLQLIATPAALLLAWFLMTRKGNFLNHWYLLYALPWVALALGAGVIWWMQRHHASGLVLALLAALVPGRVALTFRHLEKQNERGPVLAALGAAYPGKGVIEPRPLLGAFWCNSNLYHPDVVVLAEESALRTMMEQARSEKRPLFVCHSHRPFALRHSAGLMSLVENANLFERERVFYGQEESQNTVFLYRFRQ